MPREPMALAAVVLAGSVVGCRASECRTGCYADEDRDGYGNGRVAIAECGYFQRCAATPTDCDDNRSDVHPGAKEACSDRIDNDCNGLADRSDMRGCSRHPCVHDPGNEGCKTGFGFGVAAGEVEAASARVWTHTGLPTTVRLEYGVGEGFDKKLAGHSTAESGATVQLDLSNLEPKTTYRYRFVLPSGERSPVGRFRTASGPGTPVRFLASADVMVGHPERLVIFDSLARERAEFFIHLGDWPYADKAQSLADYRAFYAEYRDWPAMKRFLAQTSIYALFDDHEVDNNWDEAYREAHPDKTRNGIQVWREWFPVRRGSKGEYYRRFRFGDIEIFALDSRSHRGKNAAPDEPGPGGRPKKSMLGHAQRKWLADGLASSNAAFKLVLTSVALDFGAERNDYWTSYRRERDWIFSEITRRGVDGVVFLSSDQHWFAAHHHNSGMKELQLGPLSADLRPPVRFPPHTRGTAMVFNYAVFDYDPARQELRVEAARADGSRFYREVMKAGRGRLRVEAPKPTRFVVCPTGVVGACAHAFTSVTPATFEYAVPGLYRIQWGASAVSAPRELVAGQTLVLRRCTMDRECDTGETCRSGTCGPRERPPSAEVGGGEEAQHGR